MPDTLKIGVVIADNDEYAPILEYVKKYGGGEYTCRFKSGHTFTVENGEKRLEFYTLLSGIGKVNAAATATLLIASDMDIIVNFGLSGGISGTARDEYMIGEVFVEYDFDLSTLGYKLGQKPNGFMSFSDPKLVKHFTDMYPYIKHGVAVTGDSFVSNEKLRDYLRQEFSAMSCDMESAAIASLCNDAEIPFISIRRISDDAGNDAKDAYREMNELQETCLAEIVFSALFKL